MKVMVSKEIEQVCPMFVGASVEADVVNTPYCVALWQEIDALCALHPVNPWNIIAITFTNKAANELKNRLERMLGTAALALQSGIDIAECPEGHIIPQSGMAGVGSLHNDQGSVRDLPHAVQRHASAVNMC